jgi:hypothetical protein
MPLASNMCPALMPLHKERDTPPSASTKDRTPDMLGGDGKGFLRLDREIQYCYVSTKRINSFLAPFNFIYGAFMKLQFFDNK